MSGETLPEEPKPYEPLETYHVRLSSVHWESLLSQGHLHGWVAARRLGISLADCDAIVDAALQAAQARVELWARQQEAQ